MIDEKMQNSLRDIPGYDELPERHKIQCRMAYMMGRRDSNENLMDVLDDLENKYGGAESEEKG